MQKLHVTLLTLLFAGQLSAQTLDWGFSLTKRAGFGGFRTALDANGNLYVAGGIDDFVPYDVGPNEEEVLVEGRYMVAKYSPEGALLWAKTLTGTGNFVHSSFTIDQEGNLLFLFAYYFGNVDFDPGPGTKIYSCSSSNRDLVVAKYNADFELIWAHPFTSPTDEDSYDITSDSEGNVISVGTYTTNLLDFNPAFGQNYFMPVGPGYFYAVFVQKLTKDGKFVWARQFATTGNCHMTTETDDQNNIYLAAGIDDSLDIDPGPGKNMIGTHNGIDNSVVIKLTPLGDIAWYRHMKDTNNLGTWVNLLDINIDGDICIAGSNRSFLPNGQIHPGQGFFLNKLDADGNLLMDKRILGTGPTSFQDMKTDNQGNIIICGIFVNGTVDFDPGPDTFQITATEGHGLLAKYSKDGQFKWAYRNKVSENMFLKLVTYPDNSIGVNGAFSKNGDFDPSEEETILISGGFQSPLFLRLNDEDSTVSSLEPDETGFQVIPNPNQGSFQLIAGDDYPYQVFDLQGMLVAKGALQQGAAWIDLQQAVPGVYLIQAGRWTQKLVVF